MTTIRKTARDPLFIALIFGYILWGCAFIYQTSFVDAGVRYCRARWPTPLTPHTNVWTNQHLGSCPRLGATIVADQFRRGHRFADDLPNVDDERPERVDKT